MFCNNTKDAILKEAAQWQIEGEISGDEDLSPTGCFYLEAQAEIQSALLQGGFPCNFDSKTPIALSYIGAMHRKLTMLLYIQARRINIMTDGSDTTRGLWGAIRAKLASISRGESFGEFRNRCSSSAMASFCGDETCLHGLSIHRSL